MEALFCGDQDEEASEENTVEGEEVSEEYSSEEDDANVGWTRRWVKKAAHLLKPKELKVYKKSYKDLQQIKEMRGEDWTSQWTKENGFSFVNAKQMGSKFSFNFGLWNLAFGQVSMSSEIFNNAN